MCDICNKSPCDPRCPNAPESTPIAICDYCNNPIRKGDKDFFEMPDGTCLCKDCADDMSGTDLLLSLGCTVCCAEALV